MNTHTEESSTRRKGLSNPAKWVSLPPWIEQAFKFLSVGVLNTLLDAGLYFALTRWLGLASLPVLAKGISYSVGVINSFYWNKTWTFKVETGATWAIFLSFVLANLVGLGVNAGVMHLCLNVLSLHELLSLLFATGAAFAWNFVVSKFLVFKK
jgi:putative flippase GtrA